MSEHSEDKRLVKRMLNGEQSAFDEFFSRYHPRIHRFCSNRAPENDVDDIVIRAMRQAMRRAETYRGESSLLAWLYQVTRSELSTYYKHSGRQKDTLFIEDNVMAMQHIDSLAVDEQLTPEGTLNRQRHIALIHTMLDQLPGDYGRVLEMKYVEGITVDDIAERLSTSSIAIQSMLARARKAFKSTYVNVMAAEAE